MNQFFVASSRSRTASHRFARRPLGRTPLRTQVMLLPLALLFANFSALSLSWPLRADDPIYLPLVKQGLKVEDAKWIPMTAPTLPDGMKVEEQKKAIEALTEGVGMEKFLKNSPVSPYVLKMQSAEKLSSGSEAQRIDVWFAAHGDLDQIVDKKMIDDALGTQKTTNDRSEDRSRELSDEELKKANLVAGEQPDRSHLTFGLVEYSLLDKVRLSLVTRTQSIRTPESIIVVHAIHEGIADQPSVWRSILATTDQKSAFGSAQPYSMGAGYTKITQLQFEANVLLIETHVLFVEPQEWFQGRNLLRSKLPPIIQDGLRKFRRRLAS